MTRGIRRRALAVGLFMALLVVVPLYAGIWGGKVWDYPSLSVLESKKKGALICSLNVQPSKWIAKGQLMVIKEAWLEEQGERYYLGPIPIRFEKRGIPQLCVTLLEGETAFSKYGTNVNGQGSSGSYSCGGKTVFTYKFSSGYSLPLTLTGLGDGNDTMPIVFQKHELK